METQTMVHACCSDLMQLVAMPSCRIFDPDHVSLTIVQPDTEPFAATSFGNGIHQLWSSTHYGAH